MPVSKFSVSFEPDTIAEINERTDTPAEGGRSGAIGKSLARYFACIENTRRKFAEMLDAGEIGLILDALNGVAFYDTFSIDFMQHEIGDAISMERLDKKWKIDGTKLIEKLNGLTYSEKCALIDIVERWWIRISNGEQPKPIDALKRKDK